LHTEVFGQNLKSNFLEWLYIYFDANIGSRLYVLCNGVENMADRFKVLNEKHIEFIKQQRIFFVGTAGAEGTVNVSPKGMDTLRVINEHKVVWLNLTGSGNETSTHVQENGRMTVMFCSFAKQPLILRLYGKANVIHPRDSTWKELSSLFDEHVGARQFSNWTLNLSKHRAVMLYHSSNIEVRGKH
jgi:hypothetical protein